MTIQRHLFTIALFAAAACASGPEAQSPDEVTPSPTIDFGEPEEQEVSGIDDREFVARAMSGSMLEIESSRRVVSLEMADPGLVAFAGMVSRDHERVAKELEAIADARGYDLPIHPQARHEEMLAQLDGAPAEQIGEIYLRLQHDAHLASIDLYERCARACEDGELRAFADRTLPILRSHLNQVEQRLPSP